MRTLLFLLIPLILFAQNIEYPDTVITVKGKAYPCLITALNQSTVKLKYGKTFTSSLGLNGIDKIHFAALGIIYELKSGFKVDIEKVQKIINKRNKAIAANKRKILKKTSHPKKTLKLPVSDEKFLHFSFGAYYVPYSGSYIARSYDSNDWDRIYQIEYNLSKMEAQFTYLFTKQFGLCLNLGFNSTYSKRHYEDHSVSNYDSSDSGEIITNGLKTFGIHISFKYYLFPSLTHKVSPFISLGFGKQFSWFVDKEKNLFVKNPSQAVITENYVAFFSKINSPYKLSTAFGVEYFFNTSLSVYSMIRLSYMYASADYKYKKIYNDTSNRIRRKTEKTEISNTITNIGLGLNFYF